MSRKSQRKKLKRFIEALPVLNKGLNIQVDKKCNEVSLCAGNEKIRVFYHQDKDAFIVFRSGDEYCEIEEVKFTHRETARLNSLIDGFINNRLVNTNVKPNICGTKRPIVRTKNKNKK